MVEEGEYLCCFPQASYTELEFCQFEQCCHITNAAVVSAQEFHNPITALLNF